MSFGAKGDGIADDTTAIQNAMNSMTNGGTLEFPAGTYKYSSTLKLTKPNVKLWGYGATLTPTNVNSHAIQLLANNTHMYGFKKESPRPGDVATASLMESSAMASSLTRLQQS